MGVTKDWETLRKRIQGDLRRLDRAASGRLQVSLKREKIVVRKPMSALQGFLELHSCDQPLLASDLPQKGGHYSLKRA